MSNLVPRIGEAVQPAGAQVVPRKVAKAVQRVGHQALIATAEVLATEYVADVAMGATARVTGEEIHYSAQFPDYAYRFRRIGEIQAMAAAHKVAEMGQ